MAKAKPLDRTKHFPKDRSKRMYNMEGTREEVIAAMDNAISEIPEQYRESVRFRIDEYGYRYDENTYHDMHIFWRDIETDEELKERVDREALQESDRKERELREYERLRKQFEGK